MIIKPSILLYDEPTNNLDDDNIELVTNIIKDINNQGLSLIMVSHSSILDNITKYNQLLLRMGHWLMNKFISAIFIFLIAINISYADSITIQSTTSTRDSGLYKYLLPKYPNFNDVQIKLIAVGTGQAIINAQNCDGNILIVHDKDREDKFMANGFGSSRYNIMYNDFVIVGPKKDAANI